MRGYSTDQPDWTIQYWDSNIKCWVVLMELYYDAARDKAIEYITKLRTKNNQSSHRRYRIRRLKP
jgi:hypothetical protein